MLKAMVKWMDTQPVLVLVALLMMFIIGVWAWLDYCLSGADERESEEIRRAIREAYRKQRRNNGKQDSL